MQLIIFTLLQSVYLKFACHMTSLKTSFNFCDMHMIMMKAYCQLSLHLYLCGATGYIVTSSQWYGEIEPGLGMEQTCTLIALKTLEPAHV